MTLQQALAADGRGVISAMGGLSGHIAGLVVGTFAVGGVYLIGQSDTQIPPVVTNVGVPLAGLSLGGWFLRWFVTVHIPSVQQAHKEQIQVIAEAHKVGMLEIANAHEKAVTKVVDHASQEIDRLIAIYQDRPADALKPANQR